MCFVSGDIQWKSVYYLEGPGIHSLVLWTSKTPEKQLKTLIISSDSLFTCLNFAAIFPFKLTNSLPTFFLLLNLYIIYILTIKLILFYEFQITWKLQTPPYIYIDLTFVRPSFSFCSLHIFPCWIPGHDVMDFPSLVLSSESNLGIIKFWNSTMIVLFCFVYVCVCS